MHARDYGDLMASIHGNQDFLDKQKKMAAIAESNAAHLAETRVPGYDRIPTAAELEIMHDWATNMKRVNPKWSKRRLRKEVQKNFNIRIYK